MGHTTTITGTYVRKGCICTDGWPKLSAPFEEPPRNRAERRDKTRPRTLSRVQHHSPECNAKWEEIKQEYTR